MKKGGLSFLENLYEMRISQGFPRR